MSAIHTRSTRTSAFTLPVKEQEQQSPRICASSSTASTASTSSASTSTPSPQAASEHKDDSNNNSNSNDHSESYEAFRTASGHRTAGESSSSSSPRSPSLPWFVEYWSTSFFRAPTMVFDQLCVCNTSSAVDVVVDNADYEYYPNSRSKPQQTLEPSSSIVSIQRSNPVFDTSPTKISDSKWESLRSVVASHDDYEQYGHNNSLLDDLLDEDDETASSSHIYPSKKPARKQSIHRRRRQGSPEADAGAAIATTHLSPRSATSTSTTDLLATTLRTCHSFDQYFETGRYLCASSTIDEAGESGSEGEGSSPLDAPRLLDRQRRRRQPSPSETPTRRSRGRPTPPSPSPSAADTYTTVSLSHSFAREFDDDDHDLGPREQHFPSTPSPPRWKLKQRATRRAMPDSEETKNEDGPSALPVAGREVVLSQPLHHTPTKHPCREPDQEQDQSSHDSSAYRYLIRMSPTNYRHEESKENLPPGCDGQFYYENEQDDVFSNASSSVLLPLHPHQRIMAPLGSGDDSQRFRESVLVIPRF